MEQLKRVIIPILLLAIVLVSPLLSGTTGKIAGTVVNKTNGEPIPGANVVVSGTSLGAATDMNGQYTILFVPPGTYNVQISFIGYRKVTVNDVRVYIDQTARIDVSMESQEIEVSVSVIIGEQLTIKPDVATSVASVSDKEVASLPINNVVSAVGLQAGVRGGWSGALNGAAQPSYFSGGNGYQRGRVSVQGGLSIRGGEGDNILFMVDGVTMRDPRNNEPSTRVALSAVKDISVERGGFNAEYGQVRSGVINVVTREGAKRGYYGSFQVRMSPPGPKYNRVAGTLDVQDPNSYVLRPFFDPGISWTGTGYVDSLYTKDDNGFYWNRDLNRNGRYDKDFAESYTDLNGNGQYDSGEPFTDLNGNGIWEKESYLDINNDGMCNGMDQYDRKKYPEFQGWNSISQILCSDDKTDNDLTPAGAQRVFEYETRKVTPNNQPDYDIDAGFGGPFPFISQGLGDLRFFVSYRSTRDMLVIPLTRQDYRDYNWSAQVTSDITPTMKLRFSGMLGKQFTIRHNWDGTGTYYYPHYPTEIANVASAIAAPSDLVNLFSDYNFCPSEVAEHSLAGKLTHAINPSTYYEVSLEYFGRNYDTEPSALRDTSVKYDIVPGFQENSNPFGYWPYDTRYVLIGAGMHVAKPRDWTKVSSTTLKGDFTSQINFQNLMKAGIELNYNDLDFDYGTISSGTKGKTYSSRVQKRVFPIRGAAYVQDKLETQGFTVNLGLRLDVSDPRSAWINVNTYDPYFSGNWVETKDYPTETPPAQWQLSPRLGIAHPVSENSKLFFNYGHFRQIPQYESLFRIQRNDQRQMTSFGNPNLVLAKTISYELGYDHILFDDYLLQVAAFYNDISDQQDFTLYTSSIAGFAYSKSTSNNYQDTRGFELTLRKTTGRWWSGFANYTYQVNTTGHFGSARMFDDPSKQKEWDEATVNLYQDRPIPQPYARVNLSLFTPDDFGPSIFGHQILGGIRLNSTLDWQAGYWTTWNPKALPSVAYNVQAIDFLNTAFRLDKTIPIGKFRVQLFMDINNVFNTLRLWNTADQNYMTSLHLPKNDAYENIPGDDKVGVYRDPGVDWQPMISQKEIQKADGTFVTAPNDYRAIYYEAKSEKWWRVIDKRIETQDPNYPNDPTKKITLRVERSWEQVPDSDKARILDTKAYIEMPNASTFWFLDPRRIYFGVRLSFDFTE